MSLLSELSPNAEVVSKQYALKVNTSAAIGLQNVLKSNLGPTGTLKLLVGGAGQLKLTKDGLTLLKEMQIQHPTAALIARTATAQDEVTGDGTTSTVLLTGELLKQSELILSDSLSSNSNSLHPRIITDGYDIARDACIDFLNTFKINKTDTINDRELLLSVARTSLQTKLDHALGEKIGSAVVDAIQTIYTPDLPIDLNRVEILTLQRRTAFDSRFIRGLVLDHGGRHPDMPKVLHNVHIMICNISLEYEQTETSAGFVYSTAEEREKLVESERKWLDERCRKIIHFKRSVCQVDKNESFAIINQKGVDPLSLDIFAKEGILCLRRAKRRNMERLALACGGQPILSLEDLDNKQLGYAGKVSEESYGEDKYTFIEDCGSISSACTMLLQGPNQLTTEQMKDAVKDGLRAVKNTVEDNAVVPGGGAFEIAASIYLTETILPKTIGKLKLGIIAYAEALLIIPKTLISNSGYDVQEVLLQLKEEYINSGKIPMGVNCKTGTPMLPEQEGIYDNVRVKRQSLYLSTVLANQLLLVDEVMRAGKQMGKQQQQQQPTDE